MPGLLTQLHESIAEDLSKVCRVFDDELFSELPVVNELCTHVRQYRGKMLRPALLLLSARASGSVKPEHYTLAAVVEMVHMATLVHDDVLDEAELRRRVPTINRLKGNEAAVLLGDYLISHAYHLCSSLNSQFAARAIGATTNTVCEGELQQVSHRGDFGLTVEQYIQIITRKTASLTGTSCQLGAHFADADERESEACHAYGIDAGIAFQIVDDVLDVVGTEDRMGKTLGRDLDKRKLTLPLIDYLSNASDSAREEMIRLLSASEIDHPRLHGLLMDSGATERALAEAKRYVHSAINHLAVLPQTDARDTLTRMAQLIIQRDQ